MIFVRILVDNDLFCECKGNIDLYIHIYISHGIEIDAPCVFERSSRFVMLHKNY